MLKRLLTPSLTDFFFIAVIFWLFMADPSGWERLVTDGDTALHTRTGDYILDHGAVPKVDPFSFTKPGERWFAFQWLTGVLYALLNRWAGLKGIVLLSGAVIALTSTLLVRDMVLRGANGLVAMLLALMASNAMSIHFHARPHLFTLLFLAAAHYLIARDLEQRSWRVWLLAPLMVVWVNMHSGFPVLIASLGLLTAGCGIEAAAGGFKDWSAVKRYGGLLAACTALTLVNPNGLELHRHISRFLNNEWTLQHVHEYQSPVFRSEAMYYFMAILFGGMIAVRGLLGRSQWHSVLWVLFFASGSLVSARHVPIFIIIALPPIALELTRLLNSWAERAGRKSTAEVLREIADKATSRLAPVSAWSLGLLGASALLAGSWPVDLSGKFFPNHLVRKHAGAIATARVFTTDQWGDYLLWVNYPRQRVFIDGRSDFFQQKIGDEYLRINDGQRGWREALDRFGVDMVLAPAETAVHGLLATEPGWELVDQDKKAALYRRKSGVTTAAMR
jgi:hypothetical protein